jgi:ABC-2 type transport system permease protein
MLNPVKVDLTLVNSLKKEAPLFNQGPKTLAVLMEGTFNSSFIVHRPTEQTLASGEYGIFKEKSKPTKMIIVSDGDVIENQVVHSTNLPLTLGYDRYSNHTFSNKTFIMNCIDYMIDQSGLIALRSKDIPYRPLDKGRVKEERLYWQFFNMGLPVAVIILFGICFNYIRRRRFAN